MSATTASPPLPAATAPPQAGPQTRQPGWYIPWLFVAFFAVVVSVNGVMLYFALSTWTGLETEDHFRKGIAYNRDLAGARAQAERGWQVDSLFTPSGSRAGQIDLIFRDRDGQPLDGLRAEVTFVRPTSSGKDFATRLAPLGEGRYTAQITLPLPGQWDAQVFAVHPSGDYQKTYRILVRDE